MLTKELITKVASEAEMTKKHAEELLDATVGIILESVCSGKAVQLQGLGVLEPKERAERVIVHPGTGERTIAPAKMQINFRPAPSIKDELKNL